MGMLKIAPMMPAIFEPMSTEPRTTMGWMPTAPDIRRGWRMFIVTNQPMPMMISVGRKGLRLEEQRHRPPAAAHDTNGPKNGIMVEQARGDGGPPAPYGKPVNMLAIAAIRP